MSLSETGLLQPDGQIDMEDLSRLLDIGEVLTCVLDAPDGVPLPEGMLEELDEEELGLSPLRAQRGAAYPYAPVQYPNLPLDIDKRKVPSHDLVSEGIKKRKTAPGESVVMPVMMSKLEESDEKLAKEQLETLCWEVFGCDYKELMHADAKLSEELSEMLSEMWSFKEYVTISCSSNLHFGDGYCNKKFKVEKNLDKNGNKNGNHSQERVCDGCKARVHLVDVGLCRALIVGNSDESKAAASAAAKAANKYNGIGVDTPTRSDFFATVAEEFYQLFGFEARVKVDNSHKPVLDAERKKNAKTGQDVDVCMLVRYYDMIPADCPLGPVPMRLRDSNDSSKVPLKWGNGQFCFQKLHPNNKGKGVSKTSA